jgi:hypothetical protein
MSEASATTPERICDICGHRESDGFKIVSLWWDDFENGHAGAFEYCNAHSDEEVQAFESKCKAERQR